MIGILALEQRITRGLTDRRLVPFGGGVRKTLRPWVARITGRDRRHGLAREFVTPMRDYSDASRRGTRGVWMYYTLHQSHIYEVCEWMNTSYHERYFVRVDEAGEIARVTREEVDAWLG